MSRKATYILTCILLLLGLPAATFAQGASVSCAQDYTVQSGDSLTSIAGQLFGSGDAYSAIVDATNAAAQSGSYNTITNPSLIVPGWTLCIPNADDVQMAMDSGMMDDAMMDSSMGMMDASMMGTTILATANPGDLANDILVGLSPDLAMEQSAFSGFSGITSIESVKYSHDGTAYLTADLADSTGAIVIVDNLMSSNAMIGDGSRMIAGPSTGLVAPKGLYVVDDLGLILVADFGAKDIKVFSTDSTGDAAPLFTVDNLGGERSLWDIHHDLASDTLFVAGTDGAFLVYDNFSADHGMAGPNRVVTPINTLGGKISVNLHGIYYVPASDTLLLSDVGDAASASDGQLFTIANALNVRNTAPVVAQIAGSNTQLGNPVDIDFDGSNLYVAEKSNDMVLRFDNILAKTGMLNITADQSMAVTKAESVTVVDPSMMGQSMMMDSGMMGSAVLATANPGELANDKLVDLSADLSATQTSFSDFSGITSVESVKYGQDGAAYLTADMANSIGAIVIVDNLMNSNAMIGAGSRIIAGPTTGLVAPKGLYVVDDLGLILVADFGAKDIKVFSTDSSGNAAPLFTVTDLGSDRSLWDIHHDWASDTLFVAGTDGVALVYDNFSANQGASGPDRMVIPADESGKKISVNLHGVSYVPTSDTLLLSDVGDAASASDGQLFAINNVSMADNLVAVDLQIGGSSTQLGNPVDIDFDGSNLYVAEKSNDMVLRFDNLLAKSGTLNIAADQSMAVTKAESVVVVP
ncbi:MAG: LysM peptidoglycan-binding domain-containing protein [Anaerolineae bacterium]|nr:LysM peptidoglycan-binding domain-containing protein [Anaerolineae bacterium]